MAPTRRDVVNEALARQYFPGEDPVGRVQIVDADIGVEQVTHSRTLREASCRLSPAVLPVGESAAKAAGEGIKY